MQVKSDFTKENTPQVSIGLKHFILTLAMNEVRHSGSFKKRKKLLKAYCKSDNLEYITLVYNLNLFFELLEDYLRTEDPALFGFLKLQAGFCFIDMQDFHLLQLIHTVHRSAPKNTTSYSNESFSNSSSVRTGMVGGHLIGLD